jgi:MFS family permease
MHRYLAWIPRYERQLSALGMIGGFVTDNFMFRRVDLPNTQIIFLVYIAVAAVTILVLHGINSHTTRGPDEKPPRWQTFLPVATQFALGGLWSGFLIFYTRSAVLLASWPFLLVLVAIFIGNEVFKQYYERLVFTAVLLFFGMFSYAIVTVPIYTHQIGVFSFLLSGLAAITAFTVFLWVLFLVGRKAFVESKWPIIGASAAVYVLINVFWFTNILPPLPVALAKSGIYTDVKHVGNDYIGTGEPRAWYQQPFTQIVHVAAGQPLYAYTAVFAPVKLSTRITHNWQHYDEKRRRWVAVSKVSYPINGGRDGGYRGYTIKKNPGAGEWRVDFATADGHLLGRERFTVDQTPSTNAVQQKLD